MTSLAVVLSLALGLGVNVGVFILVNATMLRSIAGVDDPEGVALLAPRAQELPGVPGTSFRRLLTYGEFRSLEDGLTAVDRLATYHEIEVSLGVGDRARRSIAQVVTPRFFETLGLRPVQGILPSDEEPGAVVVSQRLWRAYRANGRELLGETLRVSGQPFVVRAVLPAGFHGIWRNENADLWLSLNGHSSIAGEDPKHGLRGAGNRWILWIVGRPAGGRSDIATVEAELAAWAEREDAASPPPLEASVGLGIRPAKRDDVRKALGLLGGMSLLVLLVATINASNLLLTRGIERQSDAAIAVALGARRGELVRETLWEVVQIAGAASALGVLFGYGFTRWLRGVPLGQYLPSLDQLPVDFRVVAFAGLLALLATAAASLVAAFRAASTDPALLLTGGGRSSGRRLLPLKVFAVAQVAVSVTILIGAGLLVRTFLNLQSADPGLRVEGVLNLPLDLGGEFASEAAGLVLWERLLRSAEGVPGVQSVTASSSVPLVPGGGQGHIAEVQPESHAGTESLWVPWAAIGPGYLSTLGIPRVAGRDLQWSDRSGQPAVAIVNQPLAEALWPDGRAVGERLVVAGEVHEVVGVAEPVKRLGLDAPEEPFFYLPLLQRYQDRATLQVRTVGDPARAAPALRRRLAEIAPGLPVPPAISYPEAAAESFSQQRLSAALVAGFGVLALVLVGIGLYGVLHRLVISRWRELGIRLALGGSPSGILRASLAEGLRITGLGMLFGLGASLLSARLLEGVLYGVEPIDPLSYGLVVLVFVVVSLTATYIPSRRAARTDAAEVLRYSGD